jgi:hypothetical protein
VCLYRDELRDLTHDYNHEGMMMNGTLRYDNEHGLVGKCVKKQSQNKAWRDQGDQESLFKKVRSHIERP